MNLRYFEIKVDVKGSYTVSGGTNEDEAASGTYRTRNNASVALLNRIFTAICSNFGKGTIDVDVKARPNGRYWIVGVKAPGDTEASGDDVADDPLP